MFKKIKGRFVIDIPEVTDLVRKLEKSNIGCLDEIERELLDKKQNDKLKEFIDKLEYKINIENGMMEIDNKAFKSSIIVVLSCIGIVVGFKSDSVLEAIISLFTHLANDCLGKIIQIIIIGLILFLFMTQIVRYSIIYIYKYMKYTIVYEKILLDIAKEVYENDRKPSNNSATNNSNN